MTSVPPSATVILYFVASGEANIMPCPIAISTSPLATSITPCSLVLVMVLAPIVAVLLPSPTASAPITISFV